MDLSGSQTEQNLLKAFAGESQARNRYTFFADQAEKEGLLQMAAIFRETADQEREHAKRFFSFLKGGPLEITATYPAGTLGKTMDNLKASAEGEEEEWQEIYPEFAKVAREEGFESVAKAFDMISIAEKRHAERYRALLATLEAGEAFSRGDAVIWRCRNCGYIHEGTEAPRSCPACLKPQSHFEVNPSLLSM